MTTRGEHTWAPVERPTGPQPIPDWCRDAQVVWHDGYGNPPDVRLKVIGNVRDWPEKRFRKEGHFYRAEHPDGRLEQYAHRGPIAPAPVRMFQSADGSLRKYRRSGPEWAEHGICVGTLNGVPHGSEPGEYVSVERMATSQQDGFGGDHVHIVMEDGTDLVLCGPWHTVGPAGYVEVAYVDVSKLPRRAWHWTKIGGVGGLYLTDDLFLRIMARFQPHLPIASAQYSWRDHPKLEVYREEWGMPKRFREAA